MGCRKRGGRGGVARFWPLPPLLTHTTTDLWLPRYNSPPRFSDLVTPSRDLPFYLKIFQYVIHQKIFKCETIWSVGQSILDCNPMIQALYFKQNSSHLLHCVSKVKIDKKYVMWLVPPDYKN